MGERSSAGISPAEAEFLSSASILGRLATVDADGTPHVVPVGWRYLPDLGVVEVSGRSFADTHKFRNVLARPLAALVVDDVQGPGWHPRCVLVRGRVETVEPGTDGHTEAALRIHPDKVTSWGL